MPFTPTTFPGLIIVEKELLLFNIHVDVEDPYAQGDEVHEEYGLKLCAKEDNNYDAVIITVPHKPYMDLDDKYFKSITKDKAVIADLKGIYKSKIKSREYWSL